MKRRCLLIALLVVIALAVFAVWLEPTRVSWGWLRGEAFCAGRPTSFWRAQLANVHVRDVWENHPLPGGDGQPVVHVVRVLEFHEPQGWDVWFYTKVLRLKPQQTVEIWDPFFAAQNNEAEPVLAVLRTDPDPTIRSKAEVVAHNFSWGKSLTANPDEPVP